METTPLTEVYRGWDGHQVALVRAVEGLAPAQLAYRPVPTLRPVGEVVAHIAFGRLDWFHRMGAPGSGDLARRIAPWAGEKADTEHPAETQRWLRAIDKYETSLALDSENLVAWLEATWGMIARTLATWTVADLPKTFRHAYSEKMYAVSRQWVLWRILSHDIHHGGEVALLLGLQGIETPDLGEQGGHLTELAEAAIPSARGEA